MFFKFEFVFLQIFYGESTTGAVPDEKRKLLGFETFESFFPFGIGRAVRMRKFRRLALPAGAQKLLD